MNQKAYKQMITDGIQGLPSDLLAEITDFIFLIRKKYYTPEVFEEERRQIMMHQDLAQFSQKETEHLEREFHGYEKKYPTE